MPAGIEVRHVKDCRAHTAGRCNCKPTYRAQVFDKRTGGRKRQSFATLDAAKAWRAEATVKLREGRLSGALAPTLASAVDAWLEGAERGMIRTRGREPFKPSTIRAVRQAWRLRLEDRFGSRRLDQITLPDLQDYCDELDAAKKSPSTVEGTMLVLRLVYRHAKARGVVAVDPTEGLQLRRPERGKRQPPAPDHAFKLLAALPEDHQAMWATAMLAGLRRGELMALRWEDVDLADGVLRVERSYDPTHATFGTPKSKYGIRPVPIPKTLAPYLRGHMLRTGRRDGLVFGVTEHLPFPASSAQEAADEAWKAAKLERVTPHGCRHLYASLSIAAGVNAHALCKYMGHSSIKVTFDLYGHLFPGNEAQAAKLLDAHLDRVFAVKADAG